MNITSLNTFLLLSLNSSQPTLSNGSTYHLTNIINSLSTDRIQFVPFFVGSDNNKFSDIIDVTLQNIRKDISVMISSADFEFIEFGKEHKAFVKVILFDRFHGVCYLVLTSIVWYICLTFEISGIFKSTKILCLK